VTRQALPVVLCVDAEPDEQLTDPDDPKPWLGFERAVVESGPLRERLAAATGRSACLCWFFRADLQIARTHGSPAWAFRHYAEQIRALEAAGDVIGLHPHPYRWLEEEAAWLVDHANADWLSECTERALDVFRAETGRECRAFRFGGSWIGSPVVRVLERRGVAYDLTLEPGKPGGLLPVRRQLGRLPDTRRAPTHVYRPSLIDPLSPDPDRKTGLTMVPVSTGLAPPVVMGVRERIRNAVDRVARPSRLRPVPSVADLWQGTPVLEPIIRQRLAAGERHLSLTVRSDCFGRPRCRVRIVASLDRLLELAAERSLAFVSPDELVSTCRA
jgi:hypothetical protein